MAGSRRLKRLSLQEFTSLTPKQLDILKTNQIDIEKLASFNEQQLKNLLDTTVLKSRTIIAQARASLPDFRIQSLRDIIKTQDQREFLSTGCAQIDALLGGKGFQTGSISEIFAQFGAGKSQIGLTLAIRCLLPKSQGGLQGSVLVIDTEGTWRPGRLQQIASYYPSLTQDTLMDNIRIVRPLRASEQSLILKSLVQDQGVNLQGLLKTARPIRLLIVDSVTALFRSQYPGRGLLAQRQNRLGEHMKNLYMFAVQNKALVLVTNQVIHSPDPFCPGMKAVGGNVLGHASTYRLCIRKKRGLNRILQMVDSAHLPDGQVVFKLHRRGVVSQDYQD